MGLFSSIGKAIGSVVGGITGATAQAKAAKKAADLQAQQAQLALEESRRQFDIGQAAQQPFLQAGTDALGQYGALAGINGAGPQFEAITALHNSPLYNTLYARGQEALLQNASATGGLRGGNLQGALADFGRDTLSQVIQNQLANLGGIASMGQATATNTAAQGAQFAGQQGDLLTQQGQAQAGGILAKGGRDRVAFGDLVQIGSAIAGGMGGFPGMGAGGGGVLGNSGLNTVVRTPGYGGPISVTPAEKRFSF